MIPSGFVFPSMNIRKFRLNNFFDLDFTRDSFRKRFDFLMMKLDLSIIFKGQSRHVSQYRSNSSFQTEKKSFDQIRRNLILNTSSHSIHREQVRTIFISADTEARESFDRSRVMCQDLEKGSFLLANDNDESHYFLSRLFFLRLVRQKISMKTLFAHRAYLERDFLPSFQDTFTMSSARLRAHRIQLLVITALLMVG